MGPSWRTVLQFVPMASYPFAGLHWEESGSVIITVPIRYLLVRSPELSFLQAEGAQLSQFVLIQEILPSPTHLHCPWLHSLHYVQNFSKCKSRGTLLLVMTAVQVLMWVTPRPWAGQQLQQPGLLETCASTSWNSCFRGASHHGRAPADPSTRKYLLWLWGAHAGAGEGVRGTERLRETGKCCPTPVPPSRPPPVQNAAGGVWGERGGAGPGRVLL